MTEPELRHRRISRIGDLLQRRAKAARKAGWGENGECCFSQRPSFPTSLGTTTESALETPELRWGWHFYQDTRQVPMASLQPNSASSGSPPNTRSS